MLKDDAIHFENPPLTEVALSFQFEALTNFSYADIGALREHFRADFPKIEYQPALPPSFETFGGPSVLSLPFPFLPGGIPRIWLLDESGVKVLQFQPDRFTRNWRKARNDAEYPHYKMVRAAFLDDVASLNRFLENRGLGNIKPIQCEITYVNHIAAPDGYGTLMGRVFTNWNNLQSAEVGDLENAAFNTTFIFRSEDGRPIGRVYFQASSAFDMFRNPVVQFMIMARGAPSAQTVEAAAEFLNVAHNRIVKGFVEMITAETQSEWRRGA